MMDVNLKEIKAIDSKELYRLTLECQARIYKSDTVSALKSQTLFTNSRSVLDAGCGPGALAYTIRNLVKGKQYLGIDLEDSFINIASNKLPYDNFKFERTSIFDFSKGKFDIILLFAVLQHLESTKDALSHLSTFLNKNGAFIILDAKANVDEIVAKPSIPLLKQMFDDLRKSSNARGRNTNCLIEAEDWAKTNNYKVIDKKDNSKLITLENEKEMFVSYSIYVSELIYRFYGIETDQSELLEQLKKWKKAEESQVYLSGGLWLVLSPSL